MNTIVLCLNHPSDPCPIFFAVEKKLEQFKRSPIGKDLRVRVIW
jgi:hypothetical protein